MTDRLGQTVATFFQVLMQRIRRVEGERVKGEVSLRLVSCDVQRPWLRNISRDVQLVATHQHFGQK